MLRRSAGLSRRRLAKEMKVDVNVLQLIEESGGTLVTREVAEAAKAAFAQHGLSEATLSLLNERTDPILLADSDGDSEKIAKMYYQMGEVIGRLRIIDAINRLVAKKLGIEEIPGQPFR